MLSYIEKIRQISGKILSDGQVDMVVGFRKGTMPMMNEPCFIKHADDVVHLIWDRNCGINLVNYLTHRKDKMGIIAKGCDARNIVTHIIENKVKREQLFIIGVPCKGMIDRHRIESLFAAEVESVAEIDDKIVVGGGGIEKTFKLSEVLQKNCVICIHRNPVVYDELVADPVDELKDVDRYEDVRRIEQLSPQGKTEFFDDLFASCIRCYACRNVCPLCYCDTCFVDGSRPQWVGKSQDPTDIHTFHFLRAFHCAGRCTDCGSCERACPMEIKVRLLTKKLEKDCLEMFNWEAGMDLKKRPPLTTYNPNDPNEVFR
jgi:formate dehydrogenase (coenzyme F420) beta subunit